MDTSHVSLASAARSLRSIDDCSIYSEGTDDRDGGGERDGCHVGNFETDDDERRGWTSDENMMSSAFSRTLGDGGGMSSHLDMGWDEGNDGGRDGHGMSSHLDISDDWDAESQPTGPLHERHRRLDRVRKLRSRHAGRQQVKQGRKQTRRTSDPHGPSPTCCAEVHRRLSLNKEYNRRDSAGGVKSILRPPLGQKTSAAAGRDAGDGGGVRGGRGGLDDAERSSHRVAWDLDLSVRSAREQLEGLGRAIADQRRGRNTTGDDERARVNWDMGGGGGGTMDELVAHLLRQNYGDSSELLHDSVLDGYLEEFSATSEASDSRRDDWRFSASEASSSGRGGGRAGAASESDPFDSRRAGTSRDAYDQSGYSELSAAWSATSKERSGSTNIDTDASVAPSEEGASSCPEITVGSSALTRDPTMDDDDDDEHSCPETVAEAAAPPFAYRLGDALLDARHVRPPSDPLSDTVAANTLRPLDFAWILRSDGAWRYAIVADRPTDYRGEGPGIRFVVDTEGNTKTYRLKNWGGAVRLPAANSGGRDEEDGGERCDGTVETEPPTAESDDGRNAAKHEARRARAKMPAGSHGPCHGDSSELLFADDCDTTVDTEPPDARRINGGSFADRARDGSFVDEATLASAVASITDEFCRSGLGGVEDDDDTDSGSDPETESDDGGDGGGYPLPTHAGVVSPSSFPYAPPRGAPPPSSLPFVGSSNLFLDESETSASCTFEQLAVRASAAARHGNNVRGSQISASTDYGGGSL